MKLQKTAVIALIAPIITATRQVGFDGLKRQKTSVTIRSFRITITSQTGFSRLKLQKTSLAEVRFVIEPENSIFFGKRLPNCKLCDKRESYLFLDPFPP